MADVGPDHAITTGRRESGLRKQRIVPTSSKPQPRRAARLRSSAEIASGAKTAQPERRAFEHALLDDDRDGVRATVYTEAVYIVQGSPFDCGIAAADAVVAGFRCSAEDFDRRLDGRSLDISTTHRWALERLRSELVSGDESEGPRPCARWWASR